MRLAIAAGVAVVLAAIGFVYLGLFDVAASNHPNGAIHWLLETTRDRSVARRARDIVVPDLARAELRVAGAEDFAAMCADCHPPPGRTPTALAQGLNPTPPDLTETAERLSAAQIFWTIKNGIRMSGMPAWGPTHSDDELWPVVAFVQGLPELDGHAYDELLEAARGSGHHHDAPGPAPVNAEESAHHEHDEHPHDHEHAH